MKLTKYEHACFTVEQDNKMLVVDPGEMTHDLPTLENVTAIVLTHEHGDHFDIETLKKIAEYSPNAVIYAHEDVTKQIGEPFKCVAVSVGESIQNGPFTLEFFGGKHAVIHADLPLFANLGVMINDTIFYPGDSFVEPGRKVDTLALPVGAPWLKIGEVIDYVLTVKPRFAFPTHDAVLSDIGKSMPDRMVPMFAEKNGTHYKRIDGETIEL